jgi:hypothetical protein
MLTSFLRGLATLTLTLGLMMMVALAPHGRRTRPNGSGSRSKATRALGNTEARIRAYTPQFDNVNGFNAGGGFYAITLGPYQPRRGAAFAGGTGGGGPHPVR